MDAHLKALIRTAVGPAPWYWETFPPLLAEGVEYRWGSGEDSYVVVLERACEPHPVLALGFYARPLADSASQLLVWRPERGALRVSVFDVCRLAPLEKDEWPAEQPRGAERRVVSHTPPVEEIPIPERLAGGRHEGYRSRTIDLGEILLLADGPRASRAAASIYVWQPQTGQLEVLPQEWFTAERFDLGYEWITRVIRDPRTGRFAGDGIRIPDFLLAEDGCTLAE